MMRSSKCSARCLGETLWIWGPLACAARLTCQHVSVSARLSSVSGLGTRALVLKSGVTAPGRRPDAPRAGPATRATVQVVFSRTFSLSPSAESPSNIPSSITS